MLKIIGFNGPPRCGKDSFAKTFASFLDVAGATIPVYTMPFSYPLREIAHAMVGRPYEPSDYEDFKEEVFWEFGGADGRRLMIHVSENFLKPTYGNAILPRLLLNRLPTDLQNHGLVLVPDCGFQVEATELSNIIGAENFYVARVHRQAASEFTDSREWVQHVCDGDYYNDGLKESLHYEAERLYYHLLNNLGWKF